MWNKKLHVESSLPRKKGQFSLFIGRWQPLHDGHKQLFKQVLDSGDNVLIGIRKGEVDEKNPYTAEQVQENIEKPIIDYLLIAVDYALRNDLRNHIFKQVSINAHYNKTGYRYPIFDFHKITICVLIT